MASILEGDFIKPAFILGYNECIIPAHGENTDKIILHPGVLGLGKEQVHKFLGDFLQTDEVGIAAAQHFENALKAGRLVV